MDKDIKELFGGNTVIIRCSCAEEVRTVAELAIEAFDAKNISNTVGAVLRHNDLFYEESAYKWVKLSKSWVKLSKSALRPYEEIISAVIPIQDERIPKGYVIMSPDDFCVAVSKQAGYHLSEQEFSILFQELLL